MGSGLGRAVGDGPLVAVGLGESAGTLATAVGDGVGVGAAVAVACAVGSMLAVADPDGMGDGVMGAAGGSAGDPHEINSAVPRVTLTIQYAERRRTTHSL